MLPAPVRLAVVAFAADALAGIAPADIPASLTAVSRFAATKRARLGAGALATALEQDKTFRAAVLAFARAKEPDLAAAVAGGAAPAAADPVVVAAYAYLLGRDDWPELAERVAAEAQHRHGGEREAKAQDTIDRLTEQVAAARTAGRQELESLRAELARVREELAAERKKVRAMGDRAGRAEQLQRAAEQASLTAEHALATRDAEHAAVVRELEARLADSAGALAEARQTTRGELKDDRLRARLLLDAVVQAATGLRRELALPPSDGRPADALDRGTAPGAQVPAVQGRSEDDPAVLDALLAVPLVHLIIDGYNVTKTAYPSLALEQQRSRLLSSLGALAARTGAEVTVVFDGADVAVVAAAPRGVRLVFSRAGESADDVVRRYARHEPEGRPVVVVSSDKEVAEGVRRVGARAVPSIALVRLLDR